MYSRMVKGITQEKENDDTPFPDEIHQMDKSTDPCHSIRESIEDTGSKRLSLRYMTYTVFVQVGFIALLWWFFPILREKYM